MRKIEQATEGVLILDDTIQEKAYTDENEIMSWHYSHAKKRCVKGVNFLSCLVRYGDISFPIACEALLSAKMNCSGLFSLKQQKIEFSLAMYWPTIGLELKKHGV
ncbi:MAG: hypothetical protein QRY74_01320 [Chlamydia sp.]